MTEKSAESLLKTKFFIPPIRPGYIHRQRLNTLLNGISQYPTFVSAPAGYGKTTLLPGWARQSPLPVAWLALDGEDTAPLRFLSYFVRALEATLAGGDSFPKSPQWIGYGMNHLDLLGRTEVSDRLLRWFG